MTFQFATLMDFLTMGNHGPYVWGSYLITLIAFVVIIMIPYFHKRSLGKRIRRQQRIEASAKQASTTTKIETGVN